jgi:hypothetical protein
MASEIKLGDLVENEIKVYHLTKEIGAPARPQAPLKYTKRYPKICK